MKKVESRVRRTKERELLANAPWQPDPSTELQSRVWHSETDCQSRRYMPCGSARCGSATRRSARESYTQLPHTSLPAHSNRFQKRIQHRKLCGSSATKKKGKTSCGLDTSQTLAKVRRMGVSSWGTERTLPCCWADKRGPPSRDKMYTSTYIRDSGRLRLGNSAIEPSGLRRWRMAAKMWIAVGEKDRQTGNSAMQPSSWVGKSVAGFLLIPGGIWCQ